MTRISRIGCLVAAATLAWGAGSAAQAASRVTFDVAVTACDATGNADCTGFAPFRFSQTYRFGPLTLDQEIQTPSQTIRLLSATGTADREPGHDDLAGEPRGAGVMLARTTDAGNSAVSFFQRNEMVIGDVTTGYATGIGNQGFTVPFGGSDDAFLAALLAGGSTFDFFAGFTRTGDSDATVDFSRSLSGTATVASFGDDVSAVPEPAGWMMMILGFGAIATGLRRRRPSMMPATA